MSKETLEYLNQNTLIGYTDKRGEAWHSREDMQGDEPNHYPGAIPVDDLYRRLFNWEALEGELSATALTENGVLVGGDPTRKAIMRSDTGAILGIFKQGYRAHQYSQWLVEHVEAILDADLAIGSAGLLKGGAVAFVQIEMEDTRTIAGVEFRPFLTAATSMDGSLATTYLNGAQVVVCDNTLSCALRASTQNIKIKHSRNSLGRIQEVRDALEIVDQTGDIFEEQVKQLTSEYVSDDRWVDFLAAYVRPAAETPRAKTISENKFSELNRLWNYDERVAPWKNNAFGVLSAVNTYTHHMATIKNASRAERNMLRAITGGVDKLDNATLQVLASV